MDRFIFLIVALIWFTLFYLNRPVNITQKEFEELLSREDYIIEAWISRDAADLEELKKKQENSIILKPKRIKN